MMFLGALVLSDFTTWYNKPVSIRAYAWLILSMLLYGISVITWRLASLGKDSIPWQPRLLIIFGTMGLAGFLPFANLGQGVQEFIDTPVMLIWPFLNAVVS